MISFSTLWFLDHLNKMAAQSKNGFRPFSYYDPKTDNFDDFIYYDNTPEGGDRILYGVIRGNRPNYLESTDENIWSAKVIWPLRSDGTVNKNKAPTALIQSQADEGVFIKIKDGKWYTVDSPFE